MLWRPHTLLEEEQETLRLSTHLPEGSLSVTHLLRGVGLTLSLAYSHPLTTLQRAPSLALGGIEQVCDIPHTRRLLSLKPQGPTSNPWALAMVFELWRQSQLPQLHHLWGHWANAMTPLDHEPSRVGTVSLALGL